MYCSKCGKEIPDGSKYCAFCGASFGNPVSSDISSSANELFEKTDSEIVSAVKDVKNTFSNNPVPDSEALKSDRGLLSYVLLCIITCGIYSFYFIYKMAHDINIACDGDGEKTPSLTAYIVLSIITCGIYSYIWEYKLGNRLCANAPKYGMTFQENGTSVLLWNILGMALCGIGPFIAMNILIKNSNLICSAYNRQHGYAM